MAFLLALITVLTSERGLGQSNTDSLFYNGYRILQKENVVKSFEQLVIDSLVSEQKSVGFSVFLSAIFPLPGLAHVYNKNYTKGAVVYGIHLSHLLLLGEVVKRIDDSTGPTAFQQSLATYSVLVVVGNIVYSAIDGVSGTKEYNKEIIAKWKTRYPEIIERWENSQK